MTLGATNTSYLQGMRSIVARVCQDNPRAGDKELHELIAKALRDDKSVWDEVFEYTAINLSNNYRRVFETTQDKIDAARRAEQAVRSREAVKAAVEKIKESGRRQMQLLGMICPNGKPLGLCTYGEVAQFGGWFIKLAKGKDPNKRVQETEEQLRRIQTWVDDDQAAA